MLPPARGFLSGRCAARVLALVLAASALAGASCSNPQGPDPIDPDPVDPNGAVFGGAGDIAQCGTAAENTARLLDSIPGTVFTAGDNAYPNGSTRDFAECYEPTWGRHKARTRPVPGNHDYADGRSDGRDYFNYFGANAGPAGLGYYTYDVGSWRVLALNSETDVRSDSPQLQWVRSELQNRPNPCTIAIWHRPLFSSGQNGPNPDMRTLFQLLYNHRVDIVINGHEHIYERFGPQNPFGDLDEDNGIVQFTVGTGGVPLYQIGPRRPNSDVANGNTWGVLKLTLYSGRYTFEFVPVRGSTFHDLGGGTCH